MIVLTIEGMSCGHCVSHVKKALEAIPGVLGAEVDLTSRQARVEGDAPLSALLQAVAAEGYTAREA
jgi:copper chaperone CopZ